jgi:hypothetical protein
MAALTADAVWVQETWRLREIPLSAVAGIEERRHGRELVLALGPGPADEKLGLTFPSAPEAGRWSRELQARLQQPPPDVPAGLSRRPEGVALVRRPPDVPYVELGPVTFTAQTAWAADRGLQLRAGIRGADAVIGLWRRKCPDMGPGARTVSGVAVRVEDAGDRPRLRLRWFAEEVAALTNRMLLLVAIQAALLFGAATLFAGGSALQPATGKTGAELAPAPAGRRARRAGGGDRAGTGRVAGPLAGGRDDGDRAGR